MQNCMQEAVSQLFVIFQFLNYGKVVLLKPQIAKLDRLNWVHADEVANVLKNEFFHFVKRDPRRNAFQVKEITIVFFFKLGFRCNFVWFLT
jgi:hypothetical protein